MRLHIDPPTPPAHTLARAPTHPLTHSPIHSLSHPPSSRPSIQRYPPSHQAAHARARALAHPRTRPRQPASRLAGHPASQLASKLLSQLVNQPAGQVVSWPSGQSAELPARRSPQRFQYPVSSQSHASNSMPLFPSCHESSFQPRSAPCAVGSREGWADGSASIPKSSVIVAGVRDALLAVVVQS